MTALALAAEETVCGTTIDPIVTDAISCMDEALATGDRRLRAHASNQCLAFLGVGYEKLLVQAKRTRIYGNGVAHALQAFDAILLESAEHLGDWLMDDETLRTRLQRGIDAGIEAESQIYRALHSTHQQIAR